jgi:hypothetical protein
MQPPTQAVRDEDRQLREHVEAMRVTARELPWITFEERRVAVGRALQFLKGALIPHMEAHEPMRRADAHRAILARVRRLEETKLSDTEGLQELLFGLHALVALQLDLDAQP